VRIFTHGEYSGRLLAPLHNIVPTPAPASFKHPFITTLIAPATRLRRDTRYHEPKQHARRVLLRRIAAFGSIYND
jgi:hypothetical protein